MADGLAGVMGVGGELCYRSRAPMFQPPPLPRKYDACVRDLSSAKAEIRASAAHDIVRHAREGEHRAQALRLLQKALDDESSRVRAAAAIALADLRATDAVAALVVRIEDEDADVRQMAITALGEIGDAAATQRLKRALTDKRPEVRYQAVIAYTRVVKDSSDVAAALAKSARDDDMNVRYITMRLAEEHHVTSDEVIELAAELLDDDALDVSVAAAIFLTKGGDDRGHPLVLSVIAGKTRAQKEDEREAVEAAGKAGLREAISDLERRAFGIVSKVRDTCGFHALIALAAMGHERAVASIEADLRSSNKKKRTAAMVAAGRAVLRQTLSVIEGMRDVDDDLRNEALSALRA